MNNGDLIIKYMMYLLDVEGITFISDIKRRHSHIEFSEDEWILLQEYSETANFEYENR